MILFRPYMQNMLRFLFLVGVVASFAVWQHMSNQWDYLVFTQQWPVAACVDINSTEKNTCIFPLIVKGWTIHGLWPSSNDGKDPFYCNSSYPFNENEIKDLEPAMMSKWPNLILDSPKTDFWTHEWEKHGTCGTSLPVIDTEHKYFSMSLQLNSKFDIGSMLAAHKIVPSDSFYKLDDIRSSVEDVTKTDVIIQCIFAEDRSYQALIQIEICMDKSFQPINCKEGERKLVVTPSWDLIPYNPAYENCEKNLDVKYLPFPH